MSDAEQHPPFDAREFRDALACYPTGVIIVTAVGPRREIIGITANSFSSVSLDPPLVLFSIDRQAHSARAFLQTQHFAVIVLRESQAALSNQFAKALGERWQGVDYITWDSGCPILKDALACFECKIRHTYQGGDHVILAGEVLKIIADPEGAPLLYSRGRYRKIAAE